MKKLKKKKKEKQQQQRKKWRKKLRNNMNKNNDCFHVERLEKRFNLSEMLLICLLCRKLTHIACYTSLWLTERAQSGEMQSEWRDAHAQNKRNRKKIENLI